MERGAALVTGAARRIGRAMALDLAAQGHDVVIHFHGSEAEAAGVADEARALGVRSAAIRADLCREEECATLIARSSRALGRPLSILVNNASVFEHDDIRTMTRESWDRHLESNLRAPVRLSQDFSAQAPGAGRDAGGEPIARACIVNMIDQRVRKLTPEFMSYTIAKMGLWAFTRTAAQALAPRVRVNAIGPGPTLRGARQSETHFRDQRQATILGRGTSPEEICQALRFILASPGLTGQLLCIDGGQHLAWATPDVLGVE